MLPRRPRRIVVPPSVSYTSAYPVRDHERSVRFSATWFGFDPDSARRHSDATVILRNPDGVDLALHRDPAPEQPAFVHVGFHLLEAEAVRELLAGREVGRVPVSERWDEPGYVAFTCLEPAAGRRWEPTGDVSL